MDFLPHAPFLLCVMLLYAREWHINDVLAFSDRETSHLPFYRHGCLHHDCFSNQTVLVEQTCGLWLCVRISCKISSSPFLYTRFISSVKVKFNKLMNALEGCIDFTDFISLWLPSRRFKAVARVESHRRVHSLWTKSWWIPHHLLAAGSY